MADRPTPAGGPRRPSPLATMAAEECRYDSLPPHLWRRPATASDLARQIAAVEAQLAAIERRIAGGADLAYWWDCRARTLRQLAFHREAQASLAAAPDPDRKREPGSNSKI